MRAPPHARRAADCWPGYRAGLLRFRLAHLGRGCMAVAGLLVPQALSAGMPPRLDDLALPPGSVQTSLGEGLRLYGMPADIRLLDIPVSVADVIPLLTARHPSLSDLGVYPGRAVLSGRVGADLWVIMLEPAGPRRSRGSISVLGGRPDASRARPGSVPWMPADARLRLDFAARQQGGQVTHQVWTLPLPLATARRAVDAGLRRAGWRRDAARPGPQHWMRGAARLVISIVDADGGSGILVQHHDAGAP